MIDGDLSVSFPSRGVIRIQSRSLFGDVEAPDCRRFVERVSHAPEIVEITIGRRPAPHADLRFRPDRSRLDRVVERVVTLLRQGPGIDESPSNGHVSFNGRHSPIAAWQVTLDQPGRLRLKNRALYRKSALCQAIERELMSVLGIDQYRTSSFFCTVQVDYDPGQLDRRQVIEILESVLDGAEHPTRLDKLDLHLPICTASLPLAATAQFAVPAMLPVAAAVFAYTSIPTFREARNVLVKEKRLGVDVLDAIVVVGCLGTMAIFPGAVLCWCLSFGRVLVKRTQDNSKKLLLNAFGKQPRYAWLYRDGTEVQVPLDRLQVGDLVVVNTGEVVPVDGHVVEGMAMIDQHALTGEATPAEKGVGDRVFAATLMVAGKVFVSVETAGCETASAKIGRILNDTAGYKLSSQHRGERLANKAVIPTLSIGAVGLAAMGPAGAVAVLNSDFGTGIRMAAPLTMLSSLALCAHKGILVKDGRALELMNEVDTVLFDKTGTLTRERPEVGRIIASDGFTPGRILQFAAAAERRFHHPIALAILHKARELDLILPATDDTQYKVGYGITVQVEGHTIRVGSRRFLESEGITPTPEAREALEEAHREGYTMVMVGVDDKLGGAIELQAAVRPEVREIVEGLRRRGIKHIAIISGDHEAPTRKLAESLGMDRYFAQVLPADKAEYVEKLQQEGCKVCFVGDGINDSIALKKANVSISLRGASSIATDTAHIVFLEEGLAKLCELRDIARELDRNVKRSWSMILAPNIACIAGVFTMGFGIMASVVTNNVAALAALGNGVLPLRKVAQLEAERRHRLQISQTVAADPAKSRREPPANPPPAAPEMPQPPAVPSTETLYRRRLRRPIEPAAREAISIAFSLRRHEIPMAAELHWHREEPRFTISANGLSFIVHFTAEDLVVDAELSPTGRTFATTRHRDQAVRFIESMASDLGL
jgi:heavy metal translocating P-type ATPase